MPNKVIIIDTSIMCCWLEICGKETCGQDTDKWDKVRVAEYIKSETQKGATLVLPLPVIIETVKEKKGTNLSMGDLMIKSVADFYASIGWDVVILTGDHGLKIHEHVDVSFVGVPRRRK